jgi:hypothetical protein
VNERLPARLDREALERVIRRAAELQAGERATGDGLTTDEVVALGKEVGIPPQHLHQALLEERARAGSADESGALDRIAGPGTLQAQRVVQGETAAIADALAAHLESEELFCVQRRQPTRILFEPQGGFQAAMMRSGGFARKWPFLLSKATSIVAAFTQLEPGFVHVLLSADVRSYRGAYVGGAAAAGTTGAAATAVLIALGAFVPIALVPLPIGAALGWSIVRQYPPKLERVQLGLERLLDHLETRGIPPRRELPPKPGGLMTLVIDEVRRSLGHPPTP